MTMIALSTILLGCVIHPSITRKLYGSFVENWSKKKSMKNKYYKANHRRNKDMHQRTHRFYVESPSREKKKNHKARSESKSTKNNYNRLQYSSFCPKLEI